MAQGKKLPVEIVIGAVDNVTYKVMAINEKLKKITGPLGSVGRMKSAFSALGEESGLTKLGQRLGKVGATGREFFSDLQGAVMRTAAVGAAAGGAIYGVAKSFADAGDQASMMADRLGLSKAAYQELRYAASRADVDQETFNGSMEKFSRNIALAAMGTGDALVGFEALGISVRDSRGHIRSMESLLPLVADKLKGVQNQSLRNAVAAKIFGKEGAKLNGIFAEGAAGLGRLRSEARLVGAVMSDEDIAKAEQFDDGMKSIGATLLMVRNIVGAALAPVIVDLGNKLQAFLIENRGAVQQFAADFAQKLPGYVMATVRAFEILGAIAKPVVTVIGWIASVFGETTVVLAGLLALFAPAIASFVSFAGALAGVLGPALQVAWVGITLLLGVIKGLVLAFIGLVGWPVAIAAAFVGLAVLLYNKWKPFADLVDSIWSTIKGFFGYTEVKGSFAPGSPQLGPAVGASQAADAATRTNLNRNENVLTVAFQNAPKGTRVEASKADSTIDLSMGFAMGTA